MACDIPSIEVRGSCCRAVTAEPRFYFGGVIFQISPFFPEGPLPVLVRT